MAKLILVFALLYVFSILNVNSKSLWSSRQISGGSGISRGGFRNTYRPGGIRWIGNYDNDNSYNAPHFEFLTAPTFKPVTVTSFETFTTPEFEPVTVTSFETTTTPEFETEPSFETFTTAEFKSVTDPSLETFTTPEF